MRSGLAVAAAMLATTAQAADWSKAGGPLFVGGALETVSAAAPETAAGVRVPATDQPYAEAIARAADRHGLDPKLLHALVVVESGYRAAARSSAGAVGLTQLMPATAAELGVVDREDAVENLAGGAEYLARQVVRFGDLRLALAAYNSGPGLVERLQRVPRIPETEAYVDRVLNCFLALSAGRAVRSAADCRSRRPR